MELDGLEDRRRLCMISKTREIGLGVRFLGWSASGHSGCVELWHLLQPFCLTFYTESYITHQKRFSGVFFVILGTYLGVTPKFWRPKS